MPLKTDYKNFIPSTTTKIHDIKQASDGTIINADVKFEDVTVYSQEGDTFGSADINATNAQVNANTEAIALKAPLSSPEFTDIPKAPTAPTGTDTTQLANTEFVQQEIDVHKAESATTTKLGHVKVGTSIGDTIPIIDRGSTDGNNVPPVLNFGAIPSFNDGDTILLITAYHRTNAITNGVGQWLISRHLGYDAVVDEIYKKQITIDISTGEIILTGFNAGGSNTLTATIMRIL